MIRRGDKRALRFLFAAVGGVAVSLGMLMGGIAIWGAFDEEPAPTVELEEVELISTMDRVDVSELLAEREAERVRNRELPEPPELPPRTVTGFVQLEFVVGPDGRVLECRVVGAVPGGVYEEQAVAEVSSRLYTPTFDDQGQAIASTRSEIVEFTVELPRQPVVTAGEEAAPDPEGG